jgi:peptidoglycan/LPS O-acetylase OafA/YrhL
MKYYDGTNFVSGLRAIAVLLVIIIHTGAFSKLGKVGSVLTLNGQYGVHVFFVISGFAISKSFKTKTIIGFYIRRFFRVAPLYYLFLLTILSLSYCGLYPNPVLPEYEGNLAAFDILTHFIFLNIWIPSFANTIIGVEWTLGVEFFWYIASPFLLLRPYVNLYSYIRVIAALYLILHGVRFLYIQLYDGVAYDLLPTKFGFYFFLGVLADHIRKIIQIENFKNINYFMCGFSALLFVSACIMQDGDIETIFALSTFGLLISVVDETFIGKLLNLKFINYLGIISYSVYLTHFPLSIIISNIISIDSGLILFLNVCLASVLASTFCYYFVEIPGAKLGSILENRSMH